MTAQEQMKKMLDELMGTQRDGVSREDDLKFIDDKVCKSYIMGLCPHELFNNTENPEKELSWMKPDRQAKLARANQWNPVAIMDIKHRKMDLGECPKVHAAALKADYEIASKKREYGYDVDQMEHLQAFIKDCDRKIQIAKKRLEETQDDQDKTDEAQVVHDFAEQIGKKLAEAESLGAEGKVEESMELLKEVEDLKNQKKVAEEKYRNTLPSSSVQQQKLRVCEVCAAYLSLYDNDRRLADHFGGKLHMGFIKIRDRLKELQDNVSKKREDREMERKRRRDERERERDRERKERERAREKYREEQRRDRERYRKRRSRSRSRSRSRDRSRRRRRSRSPEGKRKKYYSRSRSKSRSRSRSRSNSRSRNDSRSKRRRSRSPRSRSRSRSASRHDSRRQSRDRSSSKSKSRSRSKSPKSPKSPASD